MVKEEVSGFGWGAGGIMGGEMNATVIEQQ